MRRLLSGRRETIVLTRSQLIEINWFSPWISAACNPRVSFSTVYSYASLLTSEKPEERTVAQTFFAQFEGAVVLIGPVDPLLQDVAPTPIDNGQVLRERIAELESQLAAAQSTSTASPRSSTDALLELPRWHRNCGASVVAHARLATARTTPRGVALALTTRGYRWGCSIF